MLTENTIYACFRRQVEKQPDAPAIIDEGGSLTYAELDRMVNGIMASFPANPRFVGIVMDHGATMIASILAVLKAGAAYVPVEPFFPTERIRFIMDECKVDFVLTRRKYAGKLRGQSLRFIDGDIPTAAPDLPDYSQPHAPAYVLYTSGSTGLPKGVIVENRNVCHYVRAFRHEFNPGPGDVMLQYSVCTFDIFVEEVFATLLSGATLAIPPESAKSEIHALMRYADANKVTIISGFPYLLLKMNKLAGIPSTIRLLISGGDVLRAIFVTNLLSRAEVYNTYGPSETTVCASYFRCNGQPPLPDGTYPIGKAVLGARIQIRCRSRETRHAQIPARIYDTRGLCHAGCHADHSQRKGQCKGTPCR